MLWEEYYEKVWDWATSTSVNKISQLESFESAEEVHEVICELGFYDEKGAARLMKKALAAGVKFDKDQLMELYLTCDDKELELAMGNVIDSMMEEELVEMEEPEYKPSRKEKKEAYKMALDNLYQARGHLVQAVRMGYADVVNYCVLMADACGLDLDEIVQAKIKRNNEKYPVEKAYGSKEKYTELKG